MNDIKVTEHSLNDQTELDFSKSIIEWLANNEKDPSTVAMAHCLAGINSGKTDHPILIGDFNRCLLLLTEVPETRNHLDKLRTLSNYWRLIVLNWNQLERLFLSEVGHNWSKGDDAPDSHEFLQTMITIAKAELRMQSESKPFKVHINWGNKKEDHQVEYCFATEGEVYAFRKGIKHGVVQYPNDPLHSKDELRQFSTEVEKEAYIIGIFDSSGFDEFQEDFPPEFPVRLLSVQSNWANYNAMVQKGLTPSPDLLANEEKLLVHSVLPILNSCSDSFLNPETTAWLQMAKNVGVYVGETEGNLLALKNAWLDYIESKGGLPKLV